MSPFAGNYKSLTIVIAAFAAAILLLAMVVAGEPRPDATAKWWETGPPLPSLTGRVVDNAQLLPPAAEAAITAKLSRLEVRTGHQFVVVTVPSLKGQMIDSFGLRLGRTWGIGRRGFNDGILLIVAPTERKVRIEIGYGLEKKLSDPDSGAIIKTAILPAFRAGNYSLGIERGTDAIIAAIS